MPWERGLQVLGRDEICCLPVLALDRIVERRLMGISVLPGPWVWNEGGSGKPVAEVMGMLVQVLREDDGSGAALWCSLPVDAGLRHCKSLVEGKWDGGSEHVSRESKPWRCCTRDSG